MGSRTVDELQDHLDEGIAWRRIELHALAGAIEDAEQKYPGLPLSRAFARSGVALLYAHWEGFVKEACQGYVDFVAVRKLRFNELNDGLLKISLEALLRRLDSGDDSASAALIDVVRRPTVARTKFSKNEIVDTKSNLRHNVLLEILEKIGFPVDSFATKANLIDKSLCDARNSIAHGRDHYPDPKAFALLRDSVMEMIEEIRDMILAQARTQGYKYKV